MKVKIKVRRKKHWLKEMLMQRPPMKINKQIQQRTRTRMTVTSLRKARRQQKTHPRLHSQPLVKIKMVG